MSVKEDVARVLSQHQLARAIAAKKLDREAVMAEQAREPGAYLLTALPHGLDKFSPTLDELAELLGAEWSRIAANPFLLAQWISTLQNNRMIAEGVVPPNFAYRAVCSRCGPVPVDFISKNQLEACMWCFSPKKPNFGES